MIILKQDALVVELFIVVGEELGVEETVLGGVKVEHSEDSIDEEGAGNNGYEDLDLIHRHIVCLRFVPTTYCI